MGYFSRLAGELEFAGLGYLIEEAPCNCPSNPFLQAIEIGTDLMGENKFVNSCKVFYAKNGYLTEKQIRSLRNPRF